MMEEIIIAGFGGQGVMVMGRMLAYTGMMEGRNVSFIPSYGPEMRGGTANCSVVISERQIGSPVVTEPDTLIVMNRPSMDKFSDTLKPGGILIYNSSLIKQRPSRDDIQIISVDANDVASDLGNPKVANMVVIGCYLAVRRVLSKDTLMNSMEKVFPERRRDLIPLNQKAVDIGIEIGKV